MKLLKKTSQLFLILFAVSLFNSCEKDNEFDDSSIDFDNAFNNELYAKMNGTETQLSKKVLSDAWKSSFEINEEVEFEEFRILKGNYSDTGETYYMLKTISNDGKISISNMLVMKNGNMTLGEKTCKCETNSCSWSGCDATQSGNACRCSPCSGDCKKTSTDKEELTHA